ncbi:MAG: AraC family transcriptional regulator [Proteobacteria bacterium]|nr:AraC family transcriptional regulator [Pseudomonadota bacterium]
MSKPDKPEIPLVKAAFRKQFTIAMKAMGIDSKHYYRRVRLPVNDPQDLESPVPLRPIYRLANIVAIEEGLPEFGSIVARLTPWHKVESLVPLIGNSETLGELINTFCEHAVNQRSYAEFRLYKDNADSWFGYHGPIVLKNDVQIELYRISSMIQLVQLAAGSGWRPRRVELRMPKLITSKACPLISQSELTFSSEVSRFSIPEILLKLPVSLNIPETLPSHSSDYNINGSFIQTLRQIMPTFFERGSCKIESIADVTEIGVRTLQRRIKAHGTSYNALLGEARFSLAKSRLADPASTTTGIASQLGYTDSAHFIRAFRRWSGMTPGEFRKNVRCPEAKEKC